MCIGGAQPLVLRHGRSLRFARVTPFMELVGSSFSPF